LELDFEDLFGLSGGTFFAQYYTLRGRNGSDEVGDIQGFSNIDGERLGHLAQLWYEQWFMDKAFRIKAGKVDANEDYAFVNSAIDLLNSSAGYSPTILQMPTYPYPAWSINTFFYPSKRTHFGIGLFDSTLGECAHEEPLEREAPPDSPTDLFLISEFGFNWSEAGKGKPGRLAFGPWYQSRAVDRFDNQRTTDALGFYAVFEQKLWNPSKENEEQGLNLFLQYGYGDRAICQVTHHLSLGLVHRGLLPGRREDIAGVMLSLVSLSPEEGVAFNSQEKVWELFYRLQLSRFVGLTSDIQYIVDPSGLTSSANTLVATFRFELSIGSDSL
jgi:porin